MDDRFSLAGKVAIVTGGRRGIGKAIALAFAQAGAEVVVCDRVVDDGALLAVADEIQQLGHRSLAIQTDISQKGDVDSLVGQVLDEFGFIDILVNNAGIILKASLLETSEEDWDDIINVDLKGCYLCSQAVGKKMVERNRGNIINISSGYVLKAPLNRAAYCVAKAGVLMLTRVLALELASSNIRVNAIAPTITKTELAKSLWSDPEVLKREESAIPLGRLVEPDDIAGVALFLASDASSFITGQTIVVDGGKHT